MRIADRSPDWIWPKWTTPVTPTTSSIPSQWFGTENWWSRSKPHGLAPEPQLFRLFVCCFVFFFGPHIEKLHIEGTKVERLWHAPENIENDDTLNGRQVDQFAVDLQTDLALHVLAHFSTHHLPQSHFYVHALVVKSVQHNTVRQTGKMLKIRSGKVF